MKPWIPTLAGKALFLWAAVLLAVCAWWVIPVAPLHASAVGPAIGLTVAVLLLSLTGAAILQLTGLLEQLPEGVFRDLTCAGAGQIFCSAFIFARSALAWGAMKLFSIRLPLTSVELYLCVALTLYCAARKPGFSPAKCKVFLSSILLPLTLMFITTLIIANNELPRELMLSSDPDQHAFWAWQITKQGMIPFSLLSWGPEPFHYPAGFAVLNSLWSWLSLVSATQVVAAQPILQSQLAFLFLAFWAFLIVKVSYDARDTVVLWAFVLILFYGFLPYGYHRTYFHLEGTGRLSSLFLLAFPLLSFLSQAANAEMNGCKKALMFLGAAACGLLISVSPFHVLLPPLLAGMAILILLISSGVSARASIIPLVLSAGAISALCALDPFYIQKLAGIPDFIPIDIAPLPPGTTQISLNAALSDLLKFLTNRPSSGMLLQMLVIDGRIAGATIILTSLMLLVFGKPTWRLVPILFGALLTAGFVLFVGNALLPSLGPAVAIGTPLRLLVGYVDYNARQYALLIIVLLSAFSFATIHASFGRTISTILLCGLGIYFSITIRENDLVLVQPRVSYNGPLGTINDDDRKIVEKLRLDFFRRFGKKDGEVPKILIPNSIVEFGPEIWFFPQGGSRLLATSGSFPLAFYYGQGSRDYTLKNYRKHVCESFDLQWLRQRNIRYFFQPSEKGSQCVADLDGLKARFRTRYESGNAFVLDLGKRRKGRGPI